MYTVTQGIQKFRDLGGETSLANPTNATILKYLNLARSGDESPLLQLYPRIQNEMSTLITPTTINLVAGTVSYTLATVPEKIDKLFIKWSTSEEYRPIDFVYSQHIDYNSPEAKAASPSKPAVGFSDGKLDIFPKPSESVTAGIKLYALVLNGITDLVSTDSYVESNRVAIIEIKRALHLYYRAQKRDDLKQTWNEETEYAIAKALGNAPGRRPEQRFQVTRGNLSRYMGRGRI